MTADFASGHIASPRFERFALQTPSSSTTAALAVPASGNAAAPYSA
ncbi:hypothetical protein ABZ897_50130 [Nonomuraea sp. NPDC046802]